MALPVVRLAAVAVVLTASLLACSDEATTPGAGTGDAATGAEGDASPGGGRDAGEGGAITGQVAHIRFVNAFAPAGAKSNVDVHVRRTEYVRVVEGLAYGAVSDYATVSISTASDTALFIPDAGADPAAATGRKIIARLDRDKRYTVVLYDVFAKASPQPTDVADTLSHGLLDESGTRTQPAAGKAALWLFDSPLQSLRLTAKWGIAGRDCLPVGDVHQVDPGAVTLGIYDLTPANQACAGTPIAATAAPSDLVAGARYAVVPIGESTGELDVRVLPVQ